MTPTSTRIRTAFVATAAALALSACTANAADTANPPTTTPPATSPATTSPATTPSATTSPATTPPSAAITTPATKAPPWDLANADLDLPSWHFADDICPTGHVHLRKGVISKYSRLGRTVIVDLNGDGATEAVGVFICANGDPAYSQAVAFRHDAGGAIVTIGAIAGPDADPDTTQVRDVAAAPHAVRVLVSSLNGSDGYAHYEAVEQYRTFTWDGTAIRQTADPTSFWITGITGKAGDLVFQPAVGGVRTGSLAVTVTSSSTVRYAELRIYTGDAGMVMTSCGGQDGAGAGVCVIGTLTAGRPRTVTLTFTGRAADLALFKPYGQIDMSLLVQIRVGPQAVRDPVDFGRFVLK